MHGEKRSGFILLLTLAILISSPFVFAGFGDFWAKITGRPTSQTTSVSITVGNTIPVIYFANVTVPLSGSGTAPSEAVGLLLYVIFNATDADGVNTLVNASAKATLNYSGDFYTSTSCTFVSANSSSYQYNCTIPLPYYAVPATYSLNASVADQNNARGTLWAPTWALGSLNAMTINNTNISFPVLSTANTNTGSLGPIGINNTGNKNALRLNVTAYDIPGWNNPTKYIYAGNFSVDHSGTGCAGVALQNATYTNITSALLYRGYNASNGRENLNFCITAINGDTPADTFNTTRLFGAVSWSVLIEPYGS